MGGQVHLSPLSLSTINNAAQNMLCYSPEYWIEKCFNRSARAGEFCYQFAYRYDGIGLMAIEKVCITLLNAVKNI